MFCIAVGASTYCTKSIKGFNTRIGGEVAV
jgi:hypothetical protein